MRTNANLTRRQMLLGLGGAVATLGLAACNSATTAESGSAAGSASGSASGSAPSAATTDENVTVRVASLKGPTTIGLVHMMDETSGIPTEDGPTEPAADAEGITYSYTLSGAADEVLPLVIQGETDIALIPSNVASVLYNKTEGAVQVIDVNTLGVLYVVTGDESVQEFTDLAGKTVYLSGQGASPEYTLDFLLDAAGIADQVTIEFKSEHSECAAAIVADPTAVAVLPQPFATATLAQNDALSAPIALTDVWNEYVTDGSEFVMGVTIVRSEFAQEHPAAVADFLERHAASAAAAVDDPEGTAPLVVEAGIVANEAIAAKAIPLCNIVCLTGGEAKDALSGYLQVLYDADPSSVGGALPADDFYYEA